MNLIAFTQPVEKSPTVTLSSLNFLNSYINPARADAGESALRNTELLRKIEDECDDLGGLQIFCNPLGTDQKYYNLTMDQMMLVGMKESKVVRRTVLAKLHELEAKQAPMIPTSYAAALLEAGRLAMEVEQQAAQLALAAPKLAVHGLLLDTANTRSLTDVGKALGFRSGQHFCKQLHADGYLFKRGKVWEPYADHIEAGLFELKIVVVNDTNQKQTRVTPKGMDALALRYPNRMAA